MKKYLGQHFLVNKNKIKKIIDALELKSGDVVIEIGSGHGEITQEIGERGRGKGIKIVAIEKDALLADSLQISAVKNKWENFEIIKGDALKIISNLVNSILGTSDVQYINDNFRTSDVQKFKIVGNIPYYITGYLLRILGELENKPSLIVLTIQKEVAERICGMPFNKAQDKPKMNILAASVQFWAKPEIIDYVPKKDFRPQPKVDSAIIKLKTDANQRISRIQRIKYYKFIKALFKQPRKTILNNLVEADLRACLPAGRDFKLRSGFTRISKKTFMLEKLKKAGVDPNARPQDLTIEQIKTLSNLLSNRL